MKGFYFHEQLSNLKRVYLDSKADCMLISVSAGVTGKNCHGLCFRDQTRAWQWPPLTLEDTGGVWERQDAKSCLFSQGPSSYHRQIFTTMMGHIQGM